MFKMICASAFLMLCFIQFAPAQTGNASDAKTPLVDELLVLTETIFPYDGFRTMFFELNQKKTAELGDFLKTEIDQKITDSSNLTVAEKAEMKAKLPEFAKRLSALTRGIIEEDFDVEKWVKDSCRKRFAEKLTEGELRQINTYFRTESGKKSVQLFNKIIQLGVEGGTAESSKADDAQMEELIGKPFGSKFFDVFMDDVFGDVKVRTDEWGDKIQERIRISATEGEMKQLIEEFFAKVIKG